MTQVWMVPAFTTIVVALAHGGQLASAASYRSDNFLVEAPTKAVARQVAQTAEACRKRITAAWLGKRANEWAEVCTIDVDISSERRFGATRFAYTSEGWSGATISLRGPLDELLTRVLPHEVTHAVLTLHFGRPMPRWADEGAAILAEDSSKHDEYDRLVVGHAEHDRTYSLDHLLTSRDYPSRLDVFYSQSYSVTRFLVELRGRKAFLRFLADGMESDWDEAVKSHYGFDDLNQLDRAWRKHLKVVHTRLMIRNTARKLATVLPGMAAEHWMAQSWMTLSRAFSVQRPERITVAMPE